MYLPDLIRGLSTCCLAAAWVALFSGCASTSGTPESPPQITVTDDGLDTGAGDALGTEIRDIFLSPGDEIRVSVYGQPDLSRQIVIGPDGRFFYPLVGELDVTGRSVRELRQTIADTLSEERTYTISSGDEIAIKVYRHSDLNIQATVPQNGVISMPLAGSVKVSGLTSSQASEAIANNLSRYILRPQVTAQVLRYQGPMPIGDPQVSIDLLRLTGEKYFVLGEVRAPGVFALVGSMNLLDAIATAGGMLPDAKPKSVLLVRSGDGEREPETMVIDLNDTLKEGDMTANPRIRRGDVVFVPETTISNVGRYFAHVGQIVRPFVDLAAGIWLGQNIEAGPIDRNPDGSSATTFILSR